MATPRRQSSLKPHLNQIRQWVAEGATDLWIGHQLETTPSAVARFRRQQGILRDRAGRKPVAEAAGAPAETDAFGSAPPTVPDADAPAGPSDAAPVETSPAESPVADTDAVAAEKPAPRPRKRRGRAADEEPVVEAAAAIAGDAVAESIDAPTAEPFATEGSPAEAGGDESDADEQPSRDGGEADGEEPRSRRRGRRGGRGRRRENDGEESGDRGPERAPAEAGAPAAEGATSSSDSVELEGVFDQGTDGFGLWLDAAIRDADVYRSHWKGKRELVVTVTADQIVLRRA